MCSYSLVLGVSHFHMLGLVADSVTENEHSQGTVAIYVPSAGHVAYSHTHTHTKRFSLAGKIY